jgi:diguanylate cyclase (GGDEF)-like protein/PAS domain S-box-containing protein
MIVENIPHMVFLKDAKNLHYMLFNRAGETLTGIHREELLGRNDADFFPKEQADFFIKKDRETIQNNTLVDIPQEEIQTLNGTRTLHTKKIVLKDGAGESRYLLGISEDITERIKIENALIESQHFLKEAQAIASLGSYVLDLRTGMWSSSAVLDRLFAIDNSYERTIEGWTLLIHPNDRQMMDSYFKDEVIAKKKMFNKEYRVIRQSDMSVRWFHGLGKLEYDEDGNVLKMIGTIQDVTENKIASDTLLKLSLAVEQNPNAIVITDLEGDIEYVNAKFKSLSGYSEEELIGKNPRILQSHETSLATYAQMWNLLTRGKSWTGELINRKKDGTIYVESAIISPVKQPDGTVTHYLAIKEDVTDKKKSAEHIERLAHFDQLTGLPNKVMLDDRIKYLLNMAQRNDEHLAVMFLDLDRFKNINDTLGHTMGDKLLVKIVKRLKESVRDEDTVARLGGDEFIMLFPNTNSSTAMHIATKLIQAVSKSLTIEKHDLIITPSIGIAIYPYDGLDFETLLKNADTAMYKVKNDSRNNFHFFTQEMQADLGRNLQLLNELHHALERNELEVYYQPQISIQDGHVVGAEALLRWNHPSFGMISPAEFIPIAEESGLIIEIGEWVLRTAVHQVKKMIETGFKPFVMAVNLSAVQFRQPNLTQLVMDVLKEEQLPAEYLELELTEAVAMHKPEKVVEIMNTLHFHGIRMSIDDFGTGYSSLSYLKQFKVYKLKIDQSFISQLVNDAEDRAIVSAIIDMANNLGLQTIAEGVETSEQLAFLRLHGCKEAQGYFFSKPLPVKELEIFLKSGKNL